MTTLLRSVAVLVFTLVAGCGGVTGLGGANKSDEGKKDDDKGDDEAPDDSGKEDPNAVVPTDVAGSFLRCGPEEELVYGCGIFEESGVKAAKQAEIKAVALECIEPATPGLRKPGLASKWQKLFDVTAPCAATLTKVEVTYVGADGKDKKAAVPVVPAEKTQGSADPAPAPAPAPTGGRFAADLRKTSPPADLPCTDIVTGRGLVFATKACDAACAPNDVGRFLGCEADGQMSCACLRPEVGAAEVSLPVTTGQLEVGFSCDVINAVTFPSTQRVRASAACDTKCKESHDGSTGFIAQCAGNDAKCTCLTKGDNVFESSLTLPTAETGLDCAAAVAGTHAYSADTACHAHCRANAGKAGWLVTCAVGGTSLTCACVK